MTYAERIERVAIAQYDVLRRMLNDKFSDLTWADLSEAQREDHRAVARAGDHAVCEEVLKVPEVWSAEERDGMSRAFTEASMRHGHYESLFAVAAWLLRHRAHAAIPRGEEGG